MNLASEIGLMAYGTPEGVRKEWDTRGRGRNRPNKVDLLLREQKKIRQMLEKHLAEPHDLKPGRGGKDMVSKVQTLKNHLDNVHGKMHDIRNVNSLWGKTIHVLHQMGEYSVTLREIATWLAGLAIAGNSMAHAQAMTTIMNVIHTHLLPIAHAMMQNMGGLLAGGEGSGCRGPNCGRPKLAGRTEWQGLKVSIEHKKGDIRSKVSKSTGKEWKMRMKNDYGYFLKTKAPDGDHLDVLMGPDKNAKNVYVVHQLKLDGKTFDEDKPIVGARSLDHAMEMYHHYARPGQEILGVSTWTKEEFKQKVLSGSCCKKGDLMKSDRIRTAAMRAQRTTLSLKNPQPRRLGIPKPMVAQPREIPYSKPRVANIGKYPMVPKPRMPRLEGFGDWGEPMAGGMSHAHIDPVSWFHPPSLTKRLSNEETRIPADNPREDNDKFLDKTKRNSKDTEEFRMKMLKRGGPGGLPPQVPVRTTLVAPNTAAYMPSGLMLAAARRRRIGVGNSTAYDRRGCI